MEARHYLAQCRRHLLAGRVQLVVVGGLPGTGKTTLAAAVGDELGWSVLRSDEIRKELAGLELLEHAPSAYGEGLYTADATATTYAAMFAQARRLLSRGESVILDASFSTARWRGAAAMLAADTDADLTELRCILPFDTASARLRHRAAERQDASDATPSVAAKMAAVFERWPSATIVGTLPPVEDVLPAVLERLAAPRRRSPGPAAA